MLFAVRAKKRSCARIWQCNEDWRELVYRAQKAGSETHEENSDQQGITKGGTKHLSPPKSGFARARG
jgi:hypothetical protein